MVKQKEKREREREEMTVAPRLHNLQGSGVSKMSEF
jgi:hypothetical protein